MRKFFEITGFPWFIDISKNTSFPYIISRKPANFKVSTPNLCGDTVRIKFIRIRSKTASGQAGVYGSSWDFLKLLNI